MLLGRKNSLFEMGPESADGWGNYLVTVGGTAEKPDWALYMIDSHRGHFALNQILWYAETSAALGEGHRELAFFHVPVPEYIEVWDYEPCKGFNQERVCATDCNDGLFAAMVRGGAMRGVFVGQMCIRDSRSPRRLLMANSPPGRIRKSSSDSSGQASYRSWSVTARKS